MKYALGDVRVQTEGDAWWIAPNAVVIGNVIMKRNASVWWNAVIRGDNEPITIGENSNIQDGCVLHTDPGFPMDIGSDVTIGHMVMLHGCTIGDGSLVGIGSIVLNGAKIGKNCLIGANSLITEGKEIPDNSMVVGSPGKVIRQLTEEQIAEMRKGADRYVANWQRFKQHLVADN
ncbi:gamma carbonic anhydrase family protein [Skermanella mucosa]|uniref:gamma carbonic anhydrase family protein n=1 Tax=Skermanella mucosa TaxID=1789672 RepID=UPI00192C4A85|nr:gamma carbonic anhydrase family protein [Skermanella mucosa]UEM23804.1 gamma carbonic anhydrase family protein [Skermanella mucosa]